MTRERVHFRVGEVRGSGRLGRWLHHLGHQGNEQIVHRYPGGSWSAGVTVALPPGVRPPELEAGRLVDAYVGPCRIWRGFMDEPDWESGRFTMSGLCRQAESVAALDFAGVATSSPADAVGAAALYRGAVNWGTLVDFATGRKALPAATSVDSLSRLLDAWCELNGVRWSVDSDGQLFVVSDETVPSLFISPGVGMLGVTTEQTASRIVCGYYTLAMGYATVSAGGGSGPTVERLVSLTSRGPMSAADAQAAADAIYAQAGYETPQFTGSITVRAGQVTNRGATPVALASIVAGPMCRILGMRDPRTGALSTDVVMEESVWDAPAGTVNLTPLNAVKGDIASIVESQQGSVEF